MSFLRNLLDPLSSYRHAPGDPRLRIRMDITNKCNLLCKMCHYPSTVGQPKFDMEPATVQRIVDQIFPHAEHAGIACQYEPTMSRHFEEVLGIIGRGPLNQVGIVSNATLWSERRIAMMLDNPNINYLAVSIDGGTKETYERVRINGNWDKLVANLENFARMKAERGLPRLKPVLVFNTVLMRSTAMELVELVRLGIRLGVYRIEAIRFVEMNPELDEAIRDWEAVMPTLVEAKRLAHDHGIELFLPVEDPRLDIDRDTKREATCNTGAVGRFSKYCEAPWSAVQIYPNGDIHPCGPYGAPFGNIREQDFADIWNSPRYLELRRSLARMRLHEPCRRCDLHGFDNIERKARINEKTQKQKEGG